MIQIIEKREKEKLKEVLRLKENLVKGGDDLQKYSLRKIKARVLIHPLAKIRGSWIKNLLRQFKN